VAEEERTEAPPAPEPAPTTTAAVEETRLERARRYTYRGRIYSTIALAVLVGLYLIFLIARNTRHVKLDYVFGSANARLIWLIVISALAGWLLGLTTSFLVRRRTRRPR
jgi:uncharacterized integral membrane protein